MFETVQREGQLLKFIEGVSMTDEIKNIDDYNRLMQPNKIPCAGTESDIALIRLEKILDIRKFEIELYWKRASYFWTFIAASFGAYGLIITANEIDYANKLKFQFFIICLGLVFSLAWYLANKASKFWQINWETHLSIAEDNILGPLYKTTVNPQSYSSFWNPTKEYAASVSKINQILSFFVFLIWTALLTNFFMTDSIAFINNNDWYYILVSAVSLASVLYILIGTKSGNKNNIVMDFKIRKNVDCEEKTTKPNH